MLSRMKKSQYAREITIRKLKSFGFPKYEIKTRGPSPERRSDAYDSVNEG